MLQYKSYNGFVLVIVLIFLEIFMLLGMGALQSNLLEIKIARNILEKMRLQAAAEQQLNVIAKQLQAYLPACLIPITPAVTLVASPLTWWQAHACAENFESLQYYYVIEFLGNDACAMVATTRSADYYRISLLMTTPATLGMRTIMQRSIVKPSTGIEICRGKSRFLTVGLQAQRILI